MLTKKKTGGLAGIVAGDSAICLCNADEESLLYRGYSIDDLAPHASFEEVAWLLTRGSPPTRQELQSYRQNLVRLRALPKPLEAILDNIPKNANKMDVLRTACSALGTIESENNHQIEIADRLIAALPAALFYWQNKRSLLENEETHAGYLLHQIIGKIPDEIHRRCIDVSLILYAEHEFNASTFTVRTIASTLSDFYSAICGGIGALRGPLHGGANEAAMELMQQFSTPRQAEEGIRQMLAEKKLIMGFGHRVYTTRDPRSDIIKEWARKLCSTIEDERLFAIAEAIENRMRKEKQLFPNLDFYSALAYHFCGIPTSLFTPFFVFSRLTGWSAHLIEQRSNNKLIRPISNYIGPTQHAWKPL